MTNVSSLARGWRYGLISLAVLIADQWSKWAAVASLTRAFEASDGVRLSFSACLDRFLWFKHPSRTAPVPVIDAFWHFRYVENPGAAWGFLAGEAAASFRTPFFLILSIVAMIFLITYFRKTTADQKLLRFGLALVFGGAIGNFLDRVRLGYVIDFIDWHWYDKATWPTFNVADAAITVGVLILLGDMFLQRPVEVAPAPARPAS